MPTLGSLRQENCLEPEGNLVYIVSLCFKNNLQTPQTAKFSRETWNVLGLKGPVWAQDPQDQVLSTKKIYLLQRNKSPGIRKTGDRGRGRKREKEYWGWGEAKDCLCVEKTQTRRFIKSRQMEVYKDKRRNPVLG